MKRDYRVSHYPQIPCKPFQIVVDTMEEAKLIKHTLARYDLFLMENKHRFDYANMAVIEEYDEEEKDWLSVDEDET